MTALPMKKHIAGMGMCYWFIRDHSKALMVEHAVEPWHPQHVIAIEDKMIRHNEIPFLLPMHRIEQDRCIQVRYELTRQRVVSHWIVEQNAAAEQVLRIIYEIVAILVDCSNYLLSEQRIILEENLIFIDVETNQIQLVYVPMELSFEQQTIQDALHQLCLQWSERLDGHPLKLAEQLFHWFEGEQFHLLGFKQWLLKQIGEAERGSGVDSGQLQQAASAIPTMQTMAALSPLSPMEQDRFIPSSAAKRNSASAATMYTAQDESTVQTSSTAVPTQRWQGLSDEDRIPLEEGEEEVERQQQRVKQALAAGLFACAACWLIAWFMQAESLYWIAAGVTLLWMDACFILKQTGRLHLSFHLRQLAIGTHENALSNNKYDEFMQHNDLSVHNMADSEETIQGHYAAVAQNTSELSLDYSYNRNEDETVLLPQAMDGGSGAWSYLELERMDGKQRYDLNKDVMRIGRMADSAIEIVISDEGLSRLHAILSRYEDGYTIRDMDSKNGTMLNDTALTPFQEYKLQHGDCIVLGTTVMRYNRVERRMQPSSSSHYSMV